jgi:glutamine amidotransferase
MATAEVAIIDGGGANIASLQYALQRVGAKSILTTDVAVIEAASHVILPGVGAAAPAMARLNDSSLVPLIRSLRQPLLGICLGMQLLASRSEEDDVACIGIFPCTASKLRATPDSPVPNMGWCRATKCEQHPLLEGIEDGAWFYFAHSFAMPVAAHTVATAEHTSRFAAINSAGNFHAAQFHPERSGGAGSRLLRNFMGLHR